MIGWRRNFPVSSSGMVRVRGMLGFAMRAGKVVIGTEQVISALPSKGRLKLVLVAEGVSDATKKKITGKCEFYGVECISLKLSSDDLGDLLGKTYSPAVVGITDEGFALQIKKASQTTT